MDETKDKSKWSRLRDNAAFRNIVGYLVFVCIAAAFWCIMALNDSAMDGFEVKLNIYNVPDSVTFINDPPSDIHVVVRDKATSLLRNGGMKQPHINIDFKEYSKGNTFRITRTDILAALKSTFGANAQFVSVSLDSLNCEYTTLKGRRVPVDVVCDVTASSGNYINPKYGVNPSHILVYSAHQEILDTITRVFTERIVKRNLSEDFTFEASLIPVKNVKFVPSKVKIGINVEPLVSKESLVSIKVENVPDGERVVLFPAKVAVSYYVPMSHFNEPKSGIELSADYNDIARLKSRKVPVNITYIPNNISSVSLYTDSVEYTLVK